MTTYTLKYNGYELINEYNVSTRYNNIPNIPEDATEFYCENNALTVLPDLPLELNVLHCENNLLVTLPDLPDNLNVLHCNHNRLTILPDLPNLEFSNPLILSTLSVSSRYSMLLFVRFLT